MPDEEKKVVETTEQASEKQPEQQPETKKAETVDELKARLSELERSLANKTEESARVHKKLEKYEAAEKERQQAEMTEIEKAQQRAAELEAENQQLKRKELQRAVALEVGLPAAFADRVQGTTPEEMAEDAKKLLEAMPKPKTVVNAGPTNAGDNAKQGETEAEKRRRLLG